MLTRKGGYLFVRRAPAPPAIARAGTPRERSVIGLHAPFFYDG